MERRAALLLFVIGACQELASGLCWPKRQEQIHVGDNTKRKTRGNRPESRWDAGECMGECKFAACSMRLCESRRNGVVASGLHYCACNGAIKVTDATLVTSSKVWTMGTRGKSRLRSLDRMQSHGRSPAPRTDRALTRQLPNGETDIGMAPQGPKEA